jgi:hypothetical protein
MRRSALILQALMAVATAACADRPWHVEADEGPGDDAVSIALRAARAREDDVEEALHPGTRAERRADTLSSGGLEAFEGVGRERAISRPRPMPRGAPDVTTWVVPAARAPSPIWRCWTAVATTC